MQIGFVSERFGLRMEEVGPKRGVGWKKLVTAGVEQMGTIGQDRWYHLHAQ